MMTETVYTFFPQAGRGQLEGGGQVPLELGL